MAKLTTKLGFLEYRFCPGGPVEIVDIEVDANHRREGAGRRMLELLFHRPDVGGAPTVFAVTRATNLIAQEFYEACGFEVTGVLRRFYGREERVADAIMYGRSPRGPV